MVTHNHVSTGRKRHQTQRLISSQAQAGSATGVNPKRTQTRTQKVIREEFLVNKPRSTF